MAGYWPRSFFLRAYGPRRGQGPQTRKKTERGQYQAILTEKAWSIKDHMAFGKIFLTGHDG